MNDYINLAIEAVAQAQAGTIQVISQWFLDFLSGYMTANELW